MTGRVVKYSEPVPFHKAMPGAESVVLWKRIPEVHVAKPKRPAKPQVRLAKPDEDDGETMTQVDISRGSYHAILDKMAFARQAQTGESYAKAFTEVYSDPANVLLRDGAKYDDLAKSFDAIYGTSKSLVPAVKVAPPDALQDYVSPGPAHDELNELVAAHMKANPTLSREQSFTRIYTHPDHRPLKARVDAESVLHAQRLAPAKPFPAYARG
jgi:hypothetical protein